MDYNSLYEALYQSGLYDPAKLPEAWLPHHKAMVERIRADFPSGKMLDVGCGFGAALKAMKNFGYDVVGIDPSSTAIKDLPNCKVATADKIPFEDASFDFILCTDCLEHIQEKDLAAVANEFWRVLKAGGKAYCRIALIPEQWTQAIDKLHADGKFSEVKNLHVTLFKKDRWGEVFKTAGFSVEDINDLSNFDVILTKPQ